MKFFNNLFGRRSRGFGRRSRRNRYALDRRRGGMALGTLMTLAAPFIIRKVMNRRSERAAAY
jgi:hypothetical protein